MVSEIEVIPYRDVHGDNEYDVDDEEASYQGIRRGAVEKTRMAAKIAKLLIPKSQYAFTAPL